MGVNAAGAGGFHRAWFYPELASLRMVSLNAEISPDQVLNHLVVLCLRLGFILNAQDESGMNRGEHVVAFKISG
ncbi:MAG: hypothetical protein HKN11_18500 [Rhizobiales bacterium]|nr:hypothetical protein [Hyphomicrobiales bacterium]